MTYHLQKTLKTPLKKLLELTNSVKLKIQNQYTKFVTFLYTNNELSEREIKKTITFTIASKIIKGGERPIH